MTKTKAVLHLPALATNVPATTLMSTAPLKLVFTTKTVFVMLTASTLDAILQSQAMKQSARPLKKNKML